MKTNHVLVDFENVRIESLALLAPKQFHVHLFLGPTNTKIPTALAVGMHSLGDRARYVQLDSSAKDALDIQIAFYAGELATAKPDAFLHVISKDKGFDPLVRHLKERKIFAARSESIEDMPCFRGPVPTSVVPSVSFDPESLVALVRADLLKRGAARPRRLSTLKSTVIARIGKENESSADSVIASLVSAGTVVSEGEKIRYHFSEA